MTRPADWNAQVIEEFRANEGRVGGQFAGAPMVLVHHRGRRTGRELVNPMMYLPDDADPFVTLFSESAGRAVVSVPRTAEAEFTALCERHVLPVTRIGRVDLLVPELAVEGQFSVPLRELRMVWSGVLPARFGP